MKFRGNVSLNLDAKGRLSMPSRYRDAVSELCDSHMVVTPHFTQTHLNIYPLPAWEEVEDQLDALPSFDKGAMKLKYIMQGNANEVDMDGAGRLLLPPKLREMVGLKKEVVLIGMGRRFELWQEDAWQAQWDSFTDASLIDGDISAAMAGLQL